MTHRLLAPALALVLGLALLAGCGSDNNTTSTSSSADVCAARDKLVADVRSMRNDNAEEFATDFATARKDFEELRSVAKATYSKDLDNIETAVSNLADALSSFGSEGAMQGLEKLGKAAGELNDAAAALAEKIPCPAAA